MRAVTLNVQSLQGKHRYLEDQFIDNDVRLVALQETKEVGGYVESKEFLRISSNSEVHWGTAVWIRRRLQINGEEVAVERANLAVVCSEPMITIVILTVDGVRLLLGSCHIPHQARGVAARKEILDKIGVVVAKFRATCGIVLGIDANARVPEYVGNATGDLHSELRMKQVRSSRNGSMTGVFSCLLLSEECTMETRTPGGMRAARIPESISSRSVEWQDSMM